MRVAISAVIVLLALSACTSPSREFLAAQAANRTTSLPATPTAPAVDVEPATDGDPIPRQQVGGESGATSDPTGGLGKQPSTATTYPGAAVTTTTVAQPEIDPQDVESALAELDELLGSLGSALASIDQAFEQGE